MKYEIEAIKPSQALVELKRIVQTGDNRRIQAYLDERAEDPSIKSLLRKFRSVPGHQEVVQTYPFPNQPEYSAQKSGGYLIPKKSKKGVSLEEQEIMQLIRQKNVLLTAANSPQNKVKEKSRTLLEKCSFFDEKEGLLEASEDEVRNRKHFREYLDNRGRVVMRIDYNENGLPSSMILYNFRGNNLKSQQFLDINLQFSRQTNSKGRTEEVDSNKRRLYLLR